jgi:hypothetical protein
MQSLLGFLLRLFVVAAGLVFAASLVVVFAGVLAFWLLRSGWARLTGQRVTPFVMRVDPRAGFDSVLRRAAAGRAPRTHAMATGRSVGDVTDVEPK